MTPGPSGERAQFAASLHEMLADADVPAAARRWAAGDRAPGLAVWRALAALGVTALLVPERHGGLGAAFADVVVACEELGHHAVPGPVAESVAAVPVLLAALSGEQLSDNELHEIVISENAAPGNAASGVALPKEAPPTEAPPREARPGGAPSVAALRGPDLSDTARPGGATPGLWLGMCSPWLSGLAAGELIATVAIPPWLPWAVDADAAGLVLLADGDLVRLAEPGARHASVDPGRSVSQVTGGRALARGPDVAGAVTRALDAGALACAAQLLGAGRALLEASVRHAGQRTQFGRPIGAFQAVKHRLADVAIGLEFAGPLLGAAAAALDTNSPHAARDVSAAKVACTDAARLAARAALQVHGAIGYTVEHDLHLWLLKVRALTGAWGSQAEHRARVMAAIAAASGKEASGEAEAAGKAEAAGPAGKAGPAGDSGAASPGQLAGPAAAGELAWN